MRVVGLGACWRRRVARLCVWLAVVGFALAASRRWVVSAALLLAAVGTVVAWDHWGAPGPRPSPAVAVASAVTVTRPPGRSPAPPPKPRPFVLIESNTKRDHAVVEQAATLLRRHRELAQQRRAEIRRRRLNSIDDLSISACDDCKADELVTGWGGYNAANGKVDSCGAILNMPSVRRQARNWNVPLPELVAMAMLHEQELCLHGNRSTTIPSDAEQRFARKLRDGRLFDRFYVQVEADAHDRETVERALAIVRDHGELAFQRRDALRRHKLNQVDPLRVSVCHSCRDHLGEAYADDESGEVVACEILIDMSVIERAARSWGLPVTGVTAVLLAHEQEHCVRAPDSRETPAVDEEVRLARKIGSARLIEYTSASYGDLDSTGRWKR